MSLVLRLLAVALLLGSTVGAAERSSVERIRYVGTVSYSRVVVDLSRATTYRVQLVPADVASGSPMRVVLDVDQARIGPEAKEPLSARLALPATVHTDRYDPAAVERELDAYGARRGKDWIGDKVRQYSLVLRGDFGAHAQRKRFRLA